MSEPTEGERGEKSGKGNESTNERRKIRTRPLPDLTDLLGSYRPPISGAPDNICTPKVDSASPVIGQFNRREFSRGGGKIGARSSGPAKGQEPFAARNEQTILGRADGDMEVQSSARPKKRRRVERGRRSKKGEHKAERALQLCPSLLSPT